MPAPALTTKQISFLRSRAHEMGPLLTLGKQGITDAFCRELDDALARQELVKVRLVKLVEVDPADLAARVGAALIQKVGRMATFYRPAEQPILHLPT